MNFANNFKKIMIKKGISALDISNELGVSRSTVTHWSNGERFPKNSETITKLANLLGVSEQSFFDENYYDNEQVTIKYLDDTYASAGDGAINSENISTSMSFDKVFLQSMLGVTNFKDTHIIKCIGNSMEPTIMEGEFLFVTPFLNDFESIMNSAIYVVNFYGDIYVKRILKNPKNKTLDLISDNKKVKQSIKVEQGDLENFKVIGRVLGHFNIKSC